MSCALMPSLASISTRMFSLHGSAPKQPARSGSSEKSMPSWRADSARNSEYDGVQVRCVVPKSRITIS